MIDIEQLKEMEKAATPGPWMCRQDSERICEEDGRLIAWVDFRHYVETACHENGINDARLIAAMRSALPDVLALLEEAREKADSLVRQYEKLFRCVNQDVAVAALALKAHADEFRAFLAKFATTKREG